jgi:hypothetical protein
MRQYAGIAGIVMLARTTIVRRPRFVPADLPTDPADTWQHDPKEQRDELVLDAPHRRY